MNVLVDTSVWSLVLRRDTPRGTVQERELAKLIHEDRVVLIGPVRQELLSGVRQPRQYHELADRLRAFPDLALETPDYEEGARCYNRCRSHGIQGSSTDFLICAVCLRREMPVFTTDGDFDHYARVLRLKLHRTRKE